MHETLSVPKGFVCPDCGMDMLASAGCTHAFLVDGAGRRYARIRQEARRCGDCGCAAGEVHHAQCDEERCPVCGGQLLTCMMGFHAPHGLNGPLQLPGHGGLTTTHC